MNDLVTISGVRGYVKDGTAFLNLEDCCIGLGFTKEEVKGESHYTSIRWERVFGYLDEFGFDHKRAKNGFIPENIFYRLAMKAKNETAEAFQAKVADEILPAIRKTGTYSVDNPSPLAALQQIVTVLTDQDRKQKELESRTETVERRLTIVKDTIIQRDPNWRDGINRAINKIVKNVPDKGYQEIRTESYNLLESRAGCDLAARTRNLRNRLESHGATKTKIGSVTKMDVIESDKRLKEIYTAVVKELTISYIA